MSRNVILVIVVVFIFIIGWFLTRPKNTTTPKIAPTQTPTSTESAAPAASEAAIMTEKKLVTMTSSGFSPSDITILAGETVSWTNSDTNNHTVDSAPHPVHTAYQALNLGTIKPGEKKSLTFPKAGTYKYHDHLNPSLTGSVIVQ